MEDVIRELLDQFSTGLGQVLESMADQNPDIGWEPAAAPQDADLLWWEQPFQFAPGMTVWVAAPQPTWTHAGTITLKAAGLETVEPAEARNTWLEILGQALSTLARTIGGMIGREVTCQAGAEHAPEPFPDTGATVSLQLSGTSLPPLWIGCSSKLVALLLHPSGIEEAGAESGQTGNAISVSPTTVPPTMELLLDVELPVSISFGKTDILMKDVLKLTTGSIVELNRGVNEPVEVLVNQCLIARGEVVVVEGNYGVKIQHIVNRQDRLRSIR